MKFYIGADHAGYELKQQLKDYLEEKGIEILDLGTFSIQVVDYPDIAREVAEKVMENPGSNGLLICGSGQGMCMAANKFPGVRAALCGDIETARFSRQHNDANVLCLGGRVIDFEAAKAILDIFLNTPFEGGRHEARVKKIG